MRLGGGGGKARGMGFGRPEDNARRERESGTRSLPRRQ